MRLIYSFLFLFLLGFFQGFAQLDSLEIREFRIQRENQDSLLLNYQHTYSNRPSVLLGYNLGHSSYGELGFALHSTFHHMLFVTKFIGSEIRLGGSDFIIGPKVGLYFGMGIGIGLNAIYYTNFDEGAIVFRPEIGWTALGAKIFYGYNWNLTNKDFKGINAHQLGVSFLIPLKKYSAKKVIIQEDI
jgi:hypothetical protein